MKRSVSVLLAHCLMVASAHAQEVRRPVIDAPAEALPTPTPAPDPAPSVHVLRCPSVGWDYWWDCNRSPFLAAAKSRGLHRAPQHVPIDRELAAVAAASLFRTLDRTTERDLVTCSLVALARIGADPGRVLALARKQLRDPDQENSETAAVAMGVLGDPAAVPDLIALLEDGAAGRQLAATPGGVHYRTRSFAAYALGLLAHAHDDLALQEEVLGALERTLARPSGANCDVEVAVIQALRLLRVPPHGERAHGLQQRVIEVLMAYFDRPGTPELARAHVPTAIAAHLGRGEPGARALEQRFRTILEGGTASPSMLQSCALALGQMARRTDLCVSAVLQDFAVRPGADLQAQLFALVAVGQIGGDENRGFLLRRLGEGADTERAWTALALGILCFDARREEDGSPDSALHAALRAALRAALAATGSSEVRSACCVALGLAGARDAAEDLLTILREHSKDDELPGAAGLGLGLMQHAPALEPLRALAVSSVRPVRLQRLGHAVVALRLLGDEGTAGILLGFSSGPGVGLAARAAVRMALGHLGDARSIEPLVVALENGEEIPLARAFAAVALGTIAARSAPAWNAALSTGVNYWAATQTLTNYSTGILDFL